MIIKTILILGLVTALACGCQTVENRKVTITPSPVPAMSAEKRIPLSAALVLDAEFKNYVVKHELAGLLMESATAHYGVGRYLCGYADDVSKALFKQVTVYDSVEAARNKTDVVLIPKVARSSMSLPSPILVELVAEWTVKERAGERILWLTTTESSVTKKPTMAGMTKSVNATFQQCFDELSLKTLKAFQDSPEIKRLTESSK